MLFLAIFQCCKITKKNTAAHYRMFLIIVGMLTEGDKMLPNSVAFVKSGAQQQYICKLPTAIVPRGKVLLGMVRRVQSRHTATA